MGIDRRRPIDRLLGADAVLHTIRHTDCPVLAVAPSLEAAPATVVVGVDFSPSSANAAQSVVPIMTPGGTLHLVHVWQPADVDDEAHAQRDESYRRHVPQRFRHLIGALTVPASITVKHELREGPPTERLLDFAHAHHADLIALGRHGRGLIERLLVGSVAERVLRSATCSVFIAPEPSLPPLQTGAP